MADARTRRLISLAVVAITVVFGASQLGGGVSPVRAATFNVTSTSDDGSPGTLRWAITQANGNPDSDTINITATGTILLTSALPAITEPVDIVGPGNSQLIVDAGDVADRRVLTISFADNVHIEGITITRGYAAEGGGVYVDTTTLNIVDVNFFDNYAFDGGSGGDGGGLYIYSSTVTIDGGIFQSNDSYEDGAAIYNNSGTLTVQASFGNNTAGDQGAAIYNESGTVDVVESIITGNSSNVGIIWSSGAGADLEISLSQIYGNTLTSNSQGAVSVMEGAANINTSSIFNNTGAAFGGGLYIQSGVTVTLTDSTISGHSITQSGGGIYNDGTLTLDRVTIRGNSADQAGGIYHIGASLTVTNSTISGNSAEDDAGGIYFLSGGSLSHVTVANNIAGSDGTGVGGGIRVGNGPGDTIVTVANSLFAGNGPDNCNTNADAAENIDSIGGNLSDDTSCTPSFTETDDQNDAFAGLVALGNNGGFTQTHALQETSAAIDAANNVNCSTVDEDQRGVSRPQYVETPASTTPCDIGAFEVLAGTGCSLPPTNGFVTPRCLVIVKEAEGGGAQTFDFDYGISGQGAGVAGDFSLADGQSIGFGLQITLTEFTITETEAAGWQLSDISCVGDGVTFVDEGDTGVRVTFTGGQTGEFAYAVCTFVNEEEQEQASPTATRTATRTATPTATATPSHLPPERPDPRPVFNNGGVFQFQPYQTPTPAAPAAAAPAAPPSIRPPSTGDAGLK